jgi:hypothetical protein
MKWQERRTAKEGGREILRRRRQPRKELVEAIACIALDSERGGSWETKLQTMLHVKVGAICEWFPSPMSSDGRLGHTGQLHSGSTTASKGVTGVVVRGLAEMVTDPTADTTGEGYVRQGDGRGWGMEEEGEAWLTEVRRNAGDVGKVRRDRTESIITTDDGDRSGDEGSFTEGDREVDTPPRDSDLLSV